MDAVLNMLLDILSKGEAQAFIIAGILDFILRMIPSKKPIGILQLVGAAAVKIGELLVKFGNLLNKVLPQNLK